MNDNFTKLIALIVVGGVAKSLFGQPTSAPIASYTAAAQDLIETVKG